MPNFLLGSVLALVFAASCCMTWLVRRWAIHYQLLDHPVARSAHTQPVPVGGGVAIVVSCYLAWSWMYLQGLLELSAYMALWGGIVIAVLGLLDDRLRLDINWRLPVQLLAAVWAVVWMKSTPAIQIGPFVLDVPWLMILLSILALVWLLNLYNFMDGIDGLAGSEACFVTLVSCLLFITVGQSAVGLVVAVLGAASAGFLVWNWPPARIFMGDVGSGFVGYILGVVALHSMLDNSLNLWVWLLLLGVFVVDATTTLLRRLTSGEKWFEGHSSHAYQHAARRYGSHGKVTLAVLVINVTWLAPLAILASRFPAMGVYITLLGMLPLLYLTHRFRAGQQTPTP
ncbi:MAG: hypothetical protein RLZZ385_772 [Pseudomonadota bacterium]|jgi:Fuc2NAc and GlcNAc transferase